MANFKGNKFYEHPDSYLVGLTQKGQEFYFDKDDFDLVQHFTWHVNGNGYMRTIDRSNGPQMIFFHRMILHLEDYNVIVDHINHNKMDNRKKNLRTCNREQNAFNQKAYRNNTSGFKGVSWHKATEKWSAKISACGKQINLGIFTNKLEASKAYNEAAIKYFGEFAKLNDV